MMPLMAKHAGPAFLIGQKKPTNLTRFGILSPKKMKLSLNNLTHLKTMDNPYDAS